MTSLLAGLYGFYLILVGYRGNTSELLTDLGQEKSFAPWLVAIVVLGVMGGNKNTEKLVLPFAGLALLALILKPGTTENVKAAYDYLVGSPSLFQMSNNVVNSTTPAKTTPGSNTSTSTGQ